MRYEGVVGRGKGQGGKYPTANIPLSDTGISGIYAARAEVKGALYDAAVYIRPGSGVLETHLFGFAGDLYGTHLAVELLEKIRDDAEFADSTALAEAIAADMAAVRAYHASHV
jgi:riboflavin kinase/FMN adenylyltransferase